MVQRLTRRFAGFADNVMPADCGLDFEGISSPQSPAITENNRICNGVVGGQAQMIVQESTQGITQVKGSEKVPTTPTTPTARRQDLDQNVHRPEFCLWSHNTFRPKYTRYLKAAQGEVGYVNRLRDF